MSRPIEDVRKEIIGLRLVDFIEDGKILFLKNEDGRNYTIDLTGKDGAVVHRGNTEKENIENKLLLFDLLLEKLDICEDELWELYEK